MICNNCGSQNRKGATYCYFCYAKLDKDKKKDKGKKIDYNDFRDSKKKNKFTDRSRTQDYEDDVTINTTPSSYADARQEEAVISNDGHISQSGFSSDDTEPTITPVREEVSENKREDTYDAPAVKMPVKETPAVAEKKEDYPVPPSVPAVGSVVEPYKTEPTVHEERKAGTDVVTEHQDKPVVSETPVTPVKQETTTTSESIPAVTVELVSRSEESRKEEPKPVQPKKPTYIVRSGSLNDDDDNDDDVPAVRPESQDVANSATSEVPVKKTNDNSDRPEETRPAVSVEPVAEPGHINDKTPKIQNAPAEKKEKANDIETSERTSELPAMTLAPDMLEKLLNNTGSEAGSNGNDVSIASDSPSGEKPVDETPAPVTTELHIPEIKEDDAANVPAVNIEEPAAVPASDESFTELPAANNTPATDASASDADDAIDNKPVDVREEVSDDTVPNNPIPMYAGTPAVMDEKEDNKGNDRSNGGYSGFEEDELTEEPYRPASQSAGKSGFTDDYGDDDEDEDVNTPQKPVVIQMASSVPRLDDPVVPKKDEPAKTQESFDPDDSFESWTNRHNNDEPDEETGNEEPDADKKKKGGKKNGKKNTGENKSSSGKKNNRRSDDEYDAPEPSERPKKKADDGYDGYYKDVRPDDYGNDYVFEGLDKDVMRKVLLLGGAAAIFVIAMVVVLVFFS